MTAGNASDDLKSGAANSSQAASSASREPIIEHQKSVTTTRRLAQPWVDGDMLVRWLRVYGHIGWRSWFRRRHRDHMEIAIDDGSLVMRRIEWPND